ncbi:hypothetical protein NC651_030530 [Populus alba x Populus x berolinensis]|nr:hypothetical protein NC651_030530 [Populus alba x Populus x berolinensis]
MGCCLPVEKWRGERLERVKAQGRPQVLFTALISVVLLRRLQNITTLCNESFLSAEWRVKSKRGDRESTHWAAYTTFLSSSPESIDFSVQSFNIGRWADAKFDRDFMYVLILWIEYHSIFFQRFVLIYHIDHLVVLKRKT